MTNFEHYKDQIIKIAKEGQDIALTGGEIVACPSIECGECAFFEELTLCSAKAMFWLCEEYKESKIQIPIDTPIDAKVLVSDTGRDWYRRHYAGYEEGKYYVWSHGKTSWTCTSSSKAQHDYIKLAEEEE